MSKCNNNRCVVPKYLYCPPMLLLELLPSLLWQLLPAEDGDGAPPPPPPMCRPATCCCCCCCRAKSVCGCGTSSVLLERFFWARLAGGVWDAVVKVERRRWRRLDKGGPTPPAGRMRAKN